MTSQNTRQNNNDRRCRLCHSEHNLIQMFRNGKKTQSITDYFRKVTWNVIGIKIEPIDQATSVCFDCLLDLHNFYFFKFICLEKQKENGTDEPDNAKRPKLDYTSVENVPTPNRDKFDEIFKWLDSKGAKKVTTVEDASSQTSNNVTLDAFTQSEPKPLTHNSSQTDKPITKNRKIQTLFRGKHMSTQCESENVATETKASKIQNLSSYLANNDHFIPEIVNENKFLQADKLKSNFKFMQFDKKTEENKYSQTTNIVAGQSAKPFETFELASSHKVDKTCQTESEMLSAETQNKEIQTDPSGKKAISVQCDIFNVPRSTRRSQRKIHQSPEIIIKVEDSDVGIPISKIPDEIPMEVDSRSESDLVLVKGESSVHVCNTCSEILNSKKGLTMHIRRAHRYCPLCKMNLKSVEQAKTHGKMCKLKRGTFVKMEKVEHVPGSKEKYPNVFE
ncbi:unnamed protein product [Ceutorhynchus assimilis]|uniref:C2H2-type domain-containing protein n=1 Tax=Ceutorhynchus assimilis TaxID=467358 RepID=A0A9N9QI62_9CUCU|nr:unnamed protein product [Ceutorhynchus assimilis]